MKEIIRKAEEFALSEIKKYGLPSMMNYNISNEKGLELSKQFDANSDIVQIGTRLMDIKLGEALTKGRIQEHIAMGVTATEEFLSQFELINDVKEQIVACVKEHHGVKNWTSKESEICANADCYRFLLVENWLEFLHSLGAEDSTFEEDLALAESKLEEKWTILSIDSCKVELTSHYNMIKKIIAKVKNS
jgi:hypothetical protein